MSENPRIDELRRRVEKDPSSIAFAQLAEEYRRAGDYMQAVTICRDGLGRHPGYLSAQVTLGRALIELENFDEARAALPLDLSPMPDFSDWSLDAELDLPELTFTDPPAHDDPARDDPRLEELEGWLAAIVSDRSQQR